MQIQTFNKINTSDRYAPGNFVVIIKDNKMKTINVIAVLALVICFSGCSTIQALQQSHQNYSETEHAFIRSKGDCNISTPHIYGGTVLAFEQIFFPLMCPCSGENGLAFIALYPFFLPFFIIDLPLSIAADTITLPYTVYKQIKYGNIDIGCNEYYESMGIKRRK